LVGRVRLTIESSAADDAGDGVEVEEGEPEFFSLPAPNVNGDPNAPEPSPNKIETTTWCRAMSPGRRTMDFEANETITFYFESVLF
jgi:hypothetical protein